MRPSTVLLKLARTHPAVASAAAGVWQTLRTEDAPPHWLLLKLQDLAAARDMRSFAVGATASIDAPRHRGLADEFDRMGAYEPETTALCHALLRPGMVAIDVGANVGYFTVLFADIVGPQGYVLSFEPCRSTCTILRHNVAKNAFRHVHVVHAAVTHTTGKIQLYYSTSEETHSIGRIESTTEAAETVAAWALDVYVDQVPLSRLDLLKIDVEGADLDVLRGARALLAKHRPYVIVEASEMSSTFGYKPNALSAFLEQAGYRVLAIEQPDPLAWSGDLRGDVSSNLLAVPQEKAEIIVELLHTIVGARRRTPNAASQGAAGSREVRHTLTL
jgi:FkbM family methyltransferase